MRWLFLFLILASCGTEEGLTDFQNDWNTISNSCSEETDLNGDCRLIQVCQYDISSFCITPGALTEMES